MREIRKIDRDNKEREMKRVRETLSETEKGRHTLSNIIIEITDTQKCTSCGHLLLPPPLVTAGRISTNTS